MRNLKDMSSISEMRNSLIDRILSIKDERFLAALRDLVDSAQAVDNVYFTEEQKQMLRLSEDDVKYGRLKTQEDLDSEDSEWLRE